MRRLVQSLSFDRPPVLAAFVGPSAGALRGVAILAALAALAQMLDLVTFFQTMAVAGPSVEVNPVARAVFMHAGPAGIAALKLAIGLAVPSLLLQRARAAGCVALVRIALVVVVGIGTAGFASNLLTTYL